MIRYISTKGLVWEGDVPPPTRSAKLKVIYELKITKHLAFCMGELSIIMCIHVYAYMYMNVG